MKNRGISIIGIVVLVGLVALIAWGIEYIVTSDFSTVKIPLDSDSEIIDPVSTPLNVQNVISTTTVKIATSTATTTDTSTKAPTAPVKVVASSTPAKTAVVNTTISAPSNLSLTVTFTDKGFLPAALTVKKGQTVTFINKSSNKMWVAANPFPTSKEYPEFNEKTGAEVGSSWTFKFDKVGTWYYHNHYKPAQGAKIVVSP